MGVRGLIGFASTVCLGSCAVGTAAPARQVRTSCKPYLSICICSKCMHVILRNHANKTCEIYNMLQYITFR